MIHFISQLGLKSEPEPGGGGALTFGMGVLMLLHFIFFLSFFPFIISLKKGLTGVPVVKKR